VPVRITEARTWTLYGVRRENELGRRQLAKAAPAEEVSA